MTRDEILALAKPEGLRWMRRWMELSVRLGCMAQQEATEWRVRLVGLERWFALKDEVLQ